MQNEDNVAEHHPRALGNLRSAIGESCVSLSTSQLLENADSLRGKVILVTGGGSGIGAAFARFAATVGATVVLADVNVDNVKKIASQITENGAHDRVHCAPRTSVTEWDEMLNLFEWVDNKFGRVDVVLVNAGVTEFAKPPFDEDAYGKDGKLLPPNLLTLDINLKGALYTTKLAMHYMRKHKTKGAIVMMGSMSSFFGIPMGPMYTTAKHGVLGFMRSTFYVASAEGIRISVIAPWFTDTPILATPVKLLLAGLPFAKMEDVVRAICWGASSPDAAGTTLSVDPRGVFALPHEATQMGQGGFNDVFGQRAKVVISTLVSLREGAKLIGAAIGSGVFLTLLGGGAAYAGWKYLG